MTTRPQYFFGIGAQKAGTTWLNELLDTYAECALPVPKELHFFDIRHLAGTLATESIYMERLRGLEAMATNFARDVRAFRKHRSGTGGFPGIFQEGYLDGVNVADRLQHLQQHARYLGIRGIDDYAAFLDSLATAKGARIVGEFTPSYSALPAAAFSEMDQHFPGCRFIFIMRDPVDRFLSQLRFKQKLSAKRGVEFDPVANFDEAVTDTEFLIRSDYRRTMDTLESVIPRDRIHYLFFEEMVAPATLVANIRRIESFLGLAARPEHELLAMADRKANVSPAADFSAEQVARARAALADNYACVTERFGRLPGSWQAT